MFSRLGPRIISWRDTVIARPIPTKCRVENLDSLRALAIVMVTNQQVIAFPGFVFGPPGVWLFFTISGYLLYRGFLQTHGPLPTSRQVSSYIIRRTFNIMPVYLVTLCVMTIYFAWNSGEVSASWLIEHMLFLHADYLYWAVKLLVLFSLLLPMLVIGLSPVRSPELRLIVLLALAILSWRVFEYHKMIVLHHGGTVYLTPFLVGMAMVHVQRYITPRLGRLAVILGLAGIFAFGANLGWADTYRGWWGFDNFDAMWNYGWMVYGPCALLVVGVCAGKSAILGNPWLRLLGITSYSLFLWPRVITEYLGVSEFEFHFSVLVATIFISILSYVLIQHPAGLLGEWLSRQVSAGKQVTLTRAVLLTMTILGICLGARQAYWVSADIRVRLEIMPSYTTLAQVFVTDQRDFFDLDSAFARIEGDKWQTLELAIPELKVDKIRLDPSVGPMTIRMKSFEINYPLSSRWHSLPLDEFRPEQGVASVRLVDGEFIIETEAMHTDPILVYRGETHQPAVTLRTAAFLLWSAIAVTVLLLICGLMDRLARRFGGRLDGAGLLRA